MITELGITQAISGEYPQGVTAHVRTDGQTDYVFLQNYTDEIQFMPLDERSYTEIGTSLNGTEGEDTFTEGVKLAPYGIRILKRPSRVDL